MAEKLSPEKREKLKKLLDDLRGTIKFDGTACELIQEVRKASFNKAL